MYAHVLDDPRVVSLWDGDRLAGRWFADHSIGGLGAPGHIVWDAYLAFGKNSGWRATSSRSSRAAERPRAKRSTATIEAMDKPRCRQPNRFKRLIAFLGRRCEQTMPGSWLDEPPADPDIGVREPRRPRPHGSAGTVFLEPPL